MLNEATALTNATLTATDGSTINYQILTGWDMKLSQQCDQQWSEYNIELFQFIHDNFKDSELDEILESIQLEDKHWNWFNKSIHLYSDSYKWFYLLCDEEIQAVCVIYQPKKSILSSKQIFYIEFIAVAPWNRKNSIRDKKFRGLGTLLISSVLKYAIDELKLTPGFSLHSLPQATGYYKSLGMLHCEVADKERLKYFEIPSEKAVMLIEEKLS